MTWRAISDRPGTQARAADAPAARARLSALFRLSASLADALRAVFVPLATPLLDLAAASLDPASDPAGSDRSDGQMKKKRKSGRGLHSSTFRVNVSTFCGIRWVHDFPPVY